jgi:FtsH-binding integral membrane protein
MVIRTQTQVVILLVSNQMVNLPVVLVCRYLTDVVAQLSVVVCLTVVLCSVIGRVHKVLLLSSYRNILIVEECHDGAVGIIVIVNDIINLYCIVTLTMSFVLLPCPHPFLKFK